MKDKRNSDSFFFLCVWLDVPIKTIHWHTYTIFCFISWDQFILLIFNDYSFSFHCSHLCCLSFIYFPVSVEILSIGFSVIVGQLWTAQIKIKIKLPLLISNTINKGKVTFILFQLSFFSNAERWFDSFLVNVAKCFMSTDKIYF